MKLVVTVVALVLTTGRVAHAISAKFVAARQQDPKRPLADILASASEQVLSSPLAYSEEALEDILSPRHFVTIRTTYGGPAPSETRRAAAISRSCLDQDRGWDQSATEDLASADRRLRERAAAL